MDYEQIDRIMLAKGLFTDPAFDDTTISIEPILCTNTCPLGLYFPESEWSPSLQRAVAGNTIVIPPNGTEAVLLHELGHRYGDYYHSALSENYAENFRKRHQGCGKVLLYRGNHFEDLPKFGRLFEEGERGAIEVDLLQPLTPAELYEIKSQLYYGTYQCECIGCGYMMESEEHCRDLECPMCGGEMRRAERPSPGQPKVSYRNGAHPLIRFEFTKGVDWLVIIGATLVGTILAGIGALGYAIYKTADTTPWVVPVALAGVGAALLLRAAARQAERTTK